MIIRAAVLLSLTTAAAWADTAVTKTRTVTRLAEGVYTIRHPDAPDTFPQSNTLVVVGKTAVLVVDSCYLPSSAAQDIAEIRTWTDKPVRYLVNTHWHYDHTMGNGTYAAAFPGLSVIAHVETQRNAAGYNPEWFARYPVRTRALRDTLAAGKEDDGKPLTAERRQEIEKDLVGRDAVGTEFAAVRDRIADVALTRDLELDLGGRVVQVRHLGRGNTAGDVVVYLPAEKILASGDLLTSPVPYLGGGYPTEFPTTLRALAAIDASVIVPGHGEVQRDKVHLQRVIDFVEAVLPVVSREVYRAKNRSSLDDVKAAVVKAFDVAPWRQAFTGGADKGNLEYFDDFSWPGLIKAAHAEMWRR
jgi:glyoxylase-like metal-dependent hydrolase (beta-lactamase superfamily II)